MQLDITTARKLVTLGHLHERCPHLAPEHVDTLVAGELVLAAAAHMLPCSAATRDGWPFDTDTIPPEHDGTPGNVPLNNLVKAVILLEAELDRRLRAERAAQGTSYTPLAGYSIEAHDHEGRVFAILHKTHGRELHMHGDLTGLFDELADLVTRSVHFTDPDVLASAAYSAWHREVGGVDPTGETLPSWEEISTDPDRIDHAEAWRHAAVAAVLAEVRSHPIGRESVEPPVIHRTVDKDNRKQSPALVGG